MMCLIHKPSKVLSNGNFSPVYDKQQDIYTGTNGVLLPTLTKAIRLLLSTTDVINGDILYKGDLNKVDALGKFLKSSLPHANQ
ncbi:MAG: SusD/RagB family nutrient-binding outer membrane lipoprotein [Chitinophagaceae bacterium]